MFRVLLLAVMMLLAAGTFSATARTLPPVEPPPAPPEVPALPVKQKLLPAHEHSAKCETTSAEPVQIICILDRSGSMKALAADTIGGYNSFIERQKFEAGAAEVTTVLFDDQYEKISDAVDVKAVPELTSAEYYARGTTALLDAIGRTIMDTAGKMEREGVCPAKRRVLVMIMTDGYENASREYSKADVKTLIEATTNDYKWNYIFMGANIDSVAEAGSIGIKARHAANYSHDAKGVNRSFAQMSDAAAEVRERGTVGDDWNGE